MVMHLQEDSFYKDKLNGCYLNYSGSKWRYMKEIHSLLPQEKGLRALDLFCGGAGVASHMPIGWDITANDLNKKIIDLHLNTLKPDFQKQVETYITKYKLSKTNKEGYLDLRDYYNTQDMSPEVLYTLLCYSFNNQVRWNSKGNYNMPFGENRSEFNKNLKTKLQNFIERSLRKGVQFTSKSFDTFDFNAHDFLFIDPPYLETTATYNERGGWGVEEETVLLTKLENTTAKWMLTNQTISKGKENKLLVDFIERGVYNVHILRDTTKNCNYQRKGGETVEVIVTNY